MYKKRKLASNNEDNIWHPGIQGLEPDDDDVKKNEDNDTEDAKVAHVQSLTRLPTH